MSTVPCGDVVSSWCSVETGGRIENLVAAWLIGQKRSLLGRPGSDMEWECVPWPRFAADPNRFVSFLLEVNYAADEVGV